jgi:hypothetical protein
MDVEMEEVEINDLIASSLAMAGEVEVAPELMRRQRDERKDEGEGWLKLDLAPASWSHSARIFYPARYGE